MRPKTSKKDIAIIGISGKFAKSENIREFWKNLEEGNELIETYTDSELLDLGVPGKVLKDADYVKSGSMIKDPGSFDYAFFGYTKEEAALMDPQIRVLHEQAWSSLEDAGYNPFSYSDKIGCYFSASDNLNWRTHVMLAQSSNVNPLFIKHISNGSSISRLISYSLNLRGPSYFVDSACSSSLIAIHIACRNLLLKECKMALAGGVSISSSHKIGYHYIPGSILSGDGHCKPFDKEASGTVSGEGAGIVVLKRLEDAIIDKDHIYGVIKATAVNNDGNQKVGYTAPSVVGQVNCIKTAMQIAGVEPPEISYVEAHGTGTILGDPVEIEALNKAFDNDTNHNCAIGSVKSNLGHLDAAAGVTGVIKTTLALEKKVIPGSLHFETPNPQINFDSGPFFVNAERKEWNVDSIRFAGVSSFGIGGTNGHAILQEWPAAITVNPSSRKNELLLFGARTKSSVNAFGEQMVDFLDENPGINLADLSYTLTVRKNDYPYRRFAVGGNTTELSEMLNHEEGKAYRSDKKGVVFMFSGQGSQYYRMGKQIYEQFPFFQSIMDSGFETLQKETGIDHKKIIGYEEGDNPERVNNTRFTQPLLFLIEYAYAQLLRKYGVEPKQMIGHSLGEYVAACISGVFSFEDGLKLILERARLMSELEEGDMLFIGLPATEVESMLPDGISIAAINTENACVVSGNSEGIKSILDELNEKEIPATLLKTSHAFHSQMMDPILDAYRVVLNKVELSPPKSPFVSCSTGKSISDEEATSPDYWVTHLRNTVNFSDGLKSILEKGYNTFIEIGSAKTLLGFLRQTKSVSDALTLDAVLRHPKEKKDDSFYLLKALGTIWAKGTEVDWTAFFNGEQRNKVSAPTYVFDKIIFPCKVNPMDRLKRLVDVTGGTSVTKETETFSTEETESFVNLVDESIDDQERPELNTPYLSPETDTEKKLAELWQALFGLDQVGINDDFFELGGDSLKALTLLRKIHQTFNVQITVDEFFEQCNIKILAKEIDLLKEVGELNKAGKSTNSKQLRF